MSGSDARPEELRYLDLRLNRARNMVFRGAAPVRLTPTEFRVLATLMEEPGRICSRQRLIALCITDGAIVRERTIDVHIASLRRKLGAPVVIETLRGQGYRLRQP
jgi:DNA-binding response OmpR family regulator